MAETEGIRVLCSVLGAGEYSEVEYFFPPKDTMRTDFATFALKEFLEKGSRPFDRVLIFGVESAAWQLVRKYLPEAQRKVIPEVKFQREVDEAFRTIKETLLELNPSAVVMDLTHGYRHHPLLLLLTGVYLSMLDYMELEGVYYAMLPRGERQAEFLNLKPFLTLLETVVNAKTFRETMHAVGVSKMREKIEQERNDLGRRGLIREAAELAKIEGILKGLEELDAQLSVNFTPGIASKAEEVAKRTKEFLPLADRIYPYLVPFLESLKADLEGLGELSEQPLWEIQLRYAEQCMKLGRFTSAAINLREGLVTWACYRWSGCQDRKCETEGTCIIRGRDFRERLTNTLDAVARKQMVMPDEEFSQCAFLYNQVGELRNKICHGYIGHEEGISREKIEKRLIGLLDETKGLFQKW